MKEFNLPNMTLMALVTSCFVQIGAQLFALAVIASTIAEAPPRSFAILTGEFAYDSSAFWNIVPLITFLLFIIALGTNWKTPRRKLLLFAFMLFVIAGLIAGFFLEPAFADMIAQGYSNRIDPELQTRAARWLIFDWSVWGLGLLAGILLLFALIKPLTIAVRAPTGSNRIQ